MSDYAYASSHRTSSAGTHVPTYERTPLLSKASLAECIQNPFTANHDNGFHGPSKLVSNPNPVQPSLIMEQAYRSPNFGGIYPHSSQPDFQYQYYKDFNSDPAAYEGFQVGAVQLAPQEDGQQNSIIRQPTQTFSHQETNFSDIDINNLPVDVTLEDADELLELSTQQPERSKQAFFSSGNEHPCMEHKDNPHDNQTASFEGSVEELMEQGEEQSETTPKVATHTRATSFSQSKQMRRKATPRSTYSSISHHDDVMYYRSLLQNRDSPASISALNEINLKSQSRQNFATNLNRCLFSMAVRKASNVSGAQGKHKLDPEWIALIKSIVFQYRVLEPWEDYSKAWSECRKAIDTANRGLKFASKKK